MHSASAPMLQTPWKKMEAEGTPGMIRLLDIDRDTLPIIGDADILYGPRTVLCEFNVSSVFAIPAEAPEAIARLASARPRSSKR
jgi:hypothetical protein